MKKISYKLDVKNIWARKWMVVRVKIVGATGGNQMKQGYSLSHDQTLITYHVVFLSRGRI